MNRQQQGMGRAVKAPTGGRQGGGRTNGGSKEDGGLQGALVSGMGLGWEARALCRWKLEGERRTQGRNGGGGGWRFNRRGVRTTFSEGQVLIHIKE